MTDTVTISKDRHDALWAELNALRGLRRQVAQRLTEDQLSLKHLVVNCEMREEITVNSEEFYDEEPQVIPELAATLKKYGHLGLKNDIKANTNYVRDQLDKPLIERSTIRPNVEPGLPKINAPSGGSNVTPSYDRMPHFRESMDVLAEACEKNKPRKLPAIIGREAFDAAMSELRQSRKVIDKLKTIGVLGSQVSATYGGINNELLAIGGEPIPDREVVIEYDKDTGHDVRLRK